MYSLRFNIKLILLFKKIFKAFQDCSQAGAQQQNQGSTWSLDISEQSVQSTEN